jgi:hypothetical protein
MNPAGAPGGTCTVIALLVHEMIDDDGNAAPLIMIVLLTWEAPKLLPLITKPICTGPEDRDKPDMTGTVVTLNRIELLGTPPTVTATNPAAAPAGTGTVMLVELQLVGVAATPLNVTVLVPFVPPKFMPAMVTDVPAGPAAGIRLVMPGPDVTVKMTAFVGIPPTVTTTFPVVAPVGTGTTMPAGVQLVGDASVPLNVTVLAPCIAPRFEPATVADVPTGPIAGLRLVMTGARETIKGTALLAVPPTVTTKFPVVAPLGTETAT